LIPVEPEFFQVYSFQPLRLKHLHCDDLHIILSLSAVQIYEFHILIFIIWSAINFVIKTEFKDVWWCCLNKTG